MIVKIEIWDGFSERERERGNEEKM